MPEIPPSGKQASSHRPIVPSNQQPPTYSAAGASSGSDNQQLYKDLLKEWQRGTNADKAKLDRMVGQLKKVFAEVFLSPVTGKQPSKQDLLMARNVLEVGALIALEKHDVKGFQRQFDQLKLYYFDWRDDSESPYMRQLIGLYLLSLLAENRLSDFHCEIELLSADWVENDPYISHPVVLERYLMEGAYHKIFQAHNIVPAESYRYLVEVLIKTVRNEIANCIRTSCNSMSVAEATRMLFFGKKDETLLFSRQQQGWQYAAQEDRFKFIKRTSAPTTGVLPSTPADGGDSVMESDSSGMHEGFDGNALEGGATQGEDIAAQISYDAVRDTVLQYARCIEEII